ncbi:MAG: glutathione S-transferase family protein [Geminicoccaceae bacterium]
MSVATLPAEAPAAHAIEPVTLVQFPKVWGRNVSPFTLKLEAWLRLAEIPYTSVESMQLGRAPKGKMPYIVDGGRSIGDSTLIIEYLKTSRGIDPDAGLSARDMAQALALQRLFEDHLYYVLSWSRWVDEEGWATVGPGYFAAMPAPLRPPAQAWMRRKIRKFLVEQGIGRHSPAEIYAAGTADIEAAAVLLGDRPFFMGERLTTIDAVAYGFLANIIMVPVETELKRIALGYPNLVTWCETMEQGLEAER